MSTVAAPPCARHAGSRADTPAAPRLPGCSRHAPQPVTHTRALRVWIVEDDEVVALYLGELLRDAGHQVRSFIDPRLALQAFRGDPLAVDVVVTDQRMPALSGDALARALLAQRPRLRIILCTAYSDRIDAQGARALGIRRFLRKPFDAQALLRAVRGDDAAAPA